jgi:hypothetical protein
MNVRNLMVALAGTAVLLSLGTGTAAAQGRQGGRGNFDPAEMRARMMERYKEALEVTNDAEWKVIETRLQKVMDAQRDARMGGGRGMFGRPPGGDRGGDRGGPGGGREVNAETDALQKALDAKASADEIKTKLAKYRETRKQKEAALETARAELKKVLSVRQEAVLVMMGSLE